MESDSSKHLVSSPNLLASESSYSESHDKHSWWNTASNFSYSMICLSKSVSSKELIPIIIILI